MKWHRRAGRVLRDIVEAEKWYRKAAEQDHANGQYRLGLLYARSRGGVLRDDDEAIRWFRRSGK